LLKGKYLYKKIKSSAIPKRLRLATSRFAKTKEWRLMRADLDQGLKANDALQVVLTEEEKKRYGIKNRLAVVRFLKRYLAAHKLRYHVKSFRGQLGDFIVVQHKKP
jgi:hypothetical protein